MGYLIEREKKNKLKEIYLIFYGNLDDVSRKNIREIFFIDGMEINSLSSLTFIELLVTNPSICLQLYQAIL